jgi:hypothetical protein
MTAILITILIFSWVASIALIDAEHLLEGETLNSNSRAFNRLVVILIIGLVNPVLSIAVALLSWAMYDTTINVLRTFLGNTSVAWNTIGDSSLISRYLSKTTTLYWGSKILSLLIALLIISNIF